MCLPFFVCASASRRFMVPESKPFVRSNSFSCAKDERGSHGSSRTEVVLTRLPHHSIQELDIVTDVIPDLNGHVLQHVYLLAKGTGIRSNAHKSPPPPAHRVRPHLPVQHVHVLVVLLLHVVGGVCRSLPYTPHQDERTARAGRPHAGATHRRRSRATPRVAPRASQKAVAAVGRRAPGVSRRGGTAHLGACCSLPVHVAGPHVSHVRRSARLGWDLDARRLRTGT